MDRMKIETFVNGIRDPEIKCATYESQKATFTETVSFALAQETARIISRPQIHKIRKLETECDEPKSVIDSMKEAMKQVMEELKLGSNKPRMKCYNCDKPGHLARECGARRKRSRSTSPSSSSNNKRMTQHSSNESPLN